MSEQEVIDNLIMGITGISDVQKIVLFGSRARGDNRFDSDYDILVVKNTNEPKYKRASKYYRNLANLPCEVEIVVYTPDEIREWANVSQAFITTALNEGKLLYEH